MVDLTSWFGHDKKLDDIDQKLAASLTQSRQQSEILIGWILLGIIMLFGMLYFLAPKGFADDVPFEPIPITLLFYLIFVIARLWVAYKRPLPNWLIAASIMVDFTVLMVTIWSFHLQYNQPASFYLKAPTILYAFIFIALRTLRFDPKWILVSGVCAMIGWAILLFYAIWINDPGSLIIRDYTTYMNDSKVLIGAEIDKIVSIGVVTVILTMAISRGQRLLITAITKKKQAENLSKFFDSDVAQQITSLDGTIDAGKSTKRLAAIMMIDLRGFTTLSESLPADQVMRILHEYHEIAISIIRRHHGHIDKFLGDGILVSFGGVNHDDKAALNALNAARSLAKAFEKWDYPHPMPDGHGFKVGMALTFGEVLFGVIGVHDRLEYTLIGRPVNLAAKLEKYTKHYQCPIITSLDFWDNAMIHMDDEHKPHPDHVQEHRDQAIGGTSHRQHVVCLREV